MKVLSEKDIDPVRTTSNDICEIFQVGCFPFNPCFSCSSQYFVCYAVALSRKVHDALFYESVEDDGKL